MKISEAYNLEQQEKAKARVGAILIVLFVIMLGGVSIPWKAIALIIAGMPWYGYILLIVVGYFVLLAAVTIVGTLFKALFQK